MREVKKFAVYFPIALLFLISLYYVPNLQAIPAFLTGLAAMVVFLPYPYPEFLVFSWLNISRKIYETVIWVASFLYLLCIYIYFTPLLFDVPILKVIYYLMNSYMVYLLAIASYLACYIQAEIWDKFEEGKTLGISRLTNEKKILWIAYVIFLTLAMFF